MKMPRLQFGTGLLLLVMMATAVYSALVHLAREVIGHSIVLSFMAPAGSAAQVLVLAVGLTVSVKRWRTCPQVFASSALACGLILTSRFLGVVYNAWAFADQDYLKRLGTANLISITGWMFTVQGLLVAAGFGFFLGAVIRAADALSSGEGHREPTTHARFVSRE
jgi:hypothetical protein